MVVSWVFDTVINFWVIHFTVLLFLFFKDFFIFTMGEKVNLKSTFAQISHLLCLFKRYALLPCIFIFQLSKINHPLKSNDSKISSFLKRLNIVHSPKCIYKNGSREVAPTESPHGELPLGEYPPKTTATVHLPPCNLQYKVCWLQRFDSKLNQTMVSFKIL